MSSLSRFSKNSHLIRSCSFRGSPASASRTRLRSSAATIVASGGPASFDLQVPNILCSTPPFAGQPATCTYAQEIAFFKPELIDQEVLVIAFDKEGVVREIRRRGLEDRVAVVPNPNATPAAGREFTFLEQLIGNFGRFSNSSPTGATSGGGR